MARMVVVEMVRMVVVEMVRYRGSWASRWNKCNLLPQKVFKKDLITYQILTENNVFAFLLFIMLSSTSCHYYIWISISYWGGTCATCPPSNPHLCAGQKGSCRLMIWSIPLNEIWHGYALSYICVFFLLYSLLAEMKNLSSHSGRYCQIWKKFPFMSTMKRIYNLK